MVRFIASILIGAAIAFGLFVIMAMLVKSSGRPGDKPEAAPVIDIVMSKIDDSIREISRQPPPPPPPPMEPPKITQAEPEVVDPSAVSTFVAPTIDTGGVSTNLGVGAMRDAEATPVVRIDPKYPPQAARDGREGWVRLSFSINEVGGVEDVEVIDADPKRIFDREARRALGKWKYRPKVVDGVAVRQTGLTVELEFKLDNS